MMRDDRQVHRTGEQASRQPSDCVGDISRRRIADGVRRIARLDSDAADYLATLIAYIANAGESGAPVLEVMDEMLWDLACCRFQTQT